MSFMIERLVPVYSVAKGDQVVWRKVRTTKGDQVVWRKVRTTKGDKALQWSTWCEAQAFADLFVDKGHKSEMRIVEVFNVEAG